MLYKNKWALTALLLLSSALFAAGQRVKHYNLVRLLQENKLETSPNAGTHVLDAPGKEAITTTGVVWLKGNTFKQGAIDIDLRGKDVFLKSFLGIAFHASDTATYDLVYFRPFRFRHPDIPTRKWSVQYMSLPDFDYDKLRKAQPGVYENDINPAPAADDWFHVTIAIERDSILVYVNHSATPSLKVKKLNEKTGGKIGLWSSQGALSGDFANLAITEK
jgi:hypothetical protein